MKERPILFSGPMVKAILEGRKTQTRRVVKPQPMMPWRAWDGAAHHWQDGDDLMRCPYGQPGDRLWVRETWSLIDDHENMACIGYAAGPGIDWAREWIRCGVDRVEDARKFYGKSKAPSIFMPRWASRITLEVTGVRVERVQDITPEDKEAEGLNWNHGYGPAAFESLWNEINGKRGYGWEANPFVWVVEFKQI